MSKPRLVVASNRVAVCKGLAAPGGLAILEARSGLWLGWRGTIADAPDARTAADAMMRRLIVEDVRRSRRGFLDALASERVIASGEVAQ